MIITEEELQEILQHYDLGSLNSLEKINRASFLQPSFIFTTTTGRYFLKQYSRWNENIAWGLSFINYLIEQNYPAIKVFLTKTNKPFVQYKDTYIAIFEMMDIPEQDDLTLEEAYNMGQRLGELHLLGNKFGNIPDTILDYMSSWGFDDVIQPHQDKLAGQTELLSWIRHQLETIESQTALPAGVCHNEFTLEHVRFVNGKVAKVIDWDLVGKDALLKDLGSTLIEAFWDGKENFDVLNEIIRGYNEQRKLTNWEREHLFEAVCFGFTKFLIWEWSANFVKEHGFQTRNLKTLAFLKNLGKEEFNNHIHWNP